MNVTVIGAGVVGCAVAYELASRGAGVRVLDGRGPGQGATRASAGMLAPYIEGHLASLRELAVGGLAEYDEFVSRLRSDTAPAFEYERPGTLQVALDDTEAHILSVAARGLADIPVAHALIDGHEARRLEPALSEHVVAALVVPEHGYVTASAFTLALAEAASRKGVTFGVTRVSEVRDVAGGAQVCTAEGAIEADAVIIAAGSWSPQIRSTAPTPAVVAVRPIRGQLVHLRQLHRATSRVVWGSACYLVPWPDGSMLVGATVEDVGFEESTTAEGVRQLLDGALRLIPRLGSAAIHEVRVGLRPATPDELPIIGRSSTMSHVYYATGHHRNGVLLAPLTASLLAELMLENRERPELALTRPGRFGL